MLRISHALCRMITALSTLVISGNGVVLDCYNTSPWYYNGHQQTTYSGKTCLRWDLFNDYSAYPDNSISDAANFCRAPDLHYTPWCYISRSRDWEKCGINKCDDNILTECGHLSIESPTVLGRNITFSFTPDKHDSNAKLYWQRRRIGTTAWSTLNLNYKFTQYQTDMTYNLILTDSVRDDEQIYRVHYYNETMYCRMETKKLELKGKSCGLVQLRSKKVIRNGTVEIEYYPPNYVLTTPGNFERQWTHSSNQISTKDSFKEKLEENDVYVLIIFMFDDSLNGRYGVYCGNVLGYTNIVTVEIKEPPSLPIILGLQDIENCMNCIAGEVRENFNVSCVIDNGTRPLEVTVKIGNETYTLNPYNSTSTTFIKYFPLREYHHMKNASFSVMNSALSTPLQTTAQVFVIKTPSVQTFGVPKTLREGEDVNITCTADGGRPIPIVYFNISGSNLSSEFLHYSTFSNNIFVSMTTFKREWNKENISCCRYNEWYSSKLECSPPKQVDYFFPPSNVKLEVKFDEESQNQMYAVCTVHDSNPVCKVQLSALGEIVGPKRYSTNLSLPHGAWSAEYVVDLNVRKEDNGKTVTCVAVCTEFSVNLTDTVSILLPYPPVIKFNISGFVLNITEGKQAHVECSAESVPASNISWIEELSDGNVTKKQCPMTSNCVFSIDADAVSKRRFICLTHHLTSTDRKNLTVNILEANEDEEYGEKQKNIEQTSNKLVVWIILGSCLLVAGLIIAIILFVVISKRRQNPKVKKESRVSYQANVDKIRNSLHSPEDDLQGKQNEAAQGHEGPEYSQPAKQKMTENIDNIYSQVNKSGRSGQQHRAEDGQLLYADLDFDPNEARSKEDIKRRDSPTEYADIDYVKTKAEKDTANTSAEPENIYANQ